MTYSVYLELKTNEPIELEQWAAAVDQVSEVRMITSDTTLVVNSHTGERISRRNNTGDVELYDPTCECWYPSFRFFEGTVSSNAVSDFDRPDCHQRNVMRSLAKILGAIIVGEGGETYD